MKIKWTWFWSHNVEKFENVSELTLTDTYISFFYNNKEDYIKMELRYLVQNSIFIAQDTKEG